MKLTAEFLKQESCNFDLECVFTLDLSEKGITDLSDLKECISLEILNLSFNDISDLSVLSHLPKLQFLNLSNNLIRSLDGLENLEGLQILNLMGNTIQSASEFRKLSNLKELTQLKLIDFKNKKSNPVCHKINYIQEIQMFLPHIEIIDGHNLKLSVTEQEFSNQINNLDNDSTTLENYNNCNESWLNKNLLTIEFTENKQKNESLVNQQRETFKSLSEELSHAIKQTNDFLLNVENDIK